MDPKHREKDKSLESEHNEKDKRGRPRDGNSAIFNVLYKKRKVKLTRREDYKLGLQQPRPDQQQFRKEKRHGQSHWRELAENGDFRGFRQD